MNGRFVLNENFWINNKYFGSGGEIYGTIFYDSNDSAFRWDGTATNGSRFRGVHYETMAYMQLPGHTRSSKEYYAARPRITSDTNYWTGAVGWGTVNMDTVGDWGSGFFDSWSNPANQPAGTSHWVGVQSYHYSNGSARYGWQMAGGPIQGLWFRNSWPGFSSWKKIAMYGVNEYSGDFYASRFVDADNSSYYMDPNSYSRLDVTDTNESYTYGWFRNRNSGRGLYNQSTGMHWYTTNGYWRSAGGGYGYGGILMYNNYESDLRGYCGYYDGSGFGMLNSSGNWQIRIEYGNANMELYRVTYMNDARPYIIYDRNDTGYRLDPNSTSNEALRVRGGTLYGPNPSWGRYLAVGTNGHWTTSFASVACTNGNLHLDSQGGYGTYLQWYVGGTTYVNGSLQANIFYDRDNTGYYFGGGSGTTQMSDAYANDWFRPQGCSGIYFQSYGRGMRAPECEGNSYGNVTTYGGGRNGWQGWGIGSRHVLMSTGGDNVGLHDNSRGWIWYWNGSYTQWNYGYNYFGGDVRSWRFYDHDTSYYGDFNDWSRMYGVGSFYLRNNYDVSTNHQYGMYMANGLSTAYAIFREGGGWGYPYPDMRIAFHTGLKFGANPSYEGMRFYTDYDMSSLVWQFNGGSNYSYQYRWNNLTGYHGIYSGINNAHFYPNPDSYGSWRVIGSRNGWGGLQFDSGICLMMNQTVHGFYSTIYGWRLYLDGSLYCPGNVVAYWSDRRLKENIQELSRGEGLDTIMKLKPSRFNWRKEAFDATGGVIEGGLEEVSVIAQDTQEVLPNAVVINKTSGGKTNVVIDGEEVKDYLTVNYDKITPFLIQAIKDLKAEVDELREQLRQERNK
jgi:hypothetical protein